MSTSKKDFIGKPAPPGYVAGIGRGATGFTTRSDIGPAKESASKFARGRGGSKRDDSDEEDLNDTNFDDFAGYKSSLFTKAPYEKEDEEADLIYQSIDSQMLERGKSASRKAAASKKKKDSFQTELETPEIQQQFSDVKQDLAKISEEDWMNIPEVGDARNRKQRIAKADKITPIPESLLLYQAKLAGVGQTNVYIDPLTDVDSSIPGASTVQNPSLGQMGEIRSSYMSLKFNQMSENVGGQKSVNAEGYLTDLKALSMTQMNDAATVRHNEKMFKTILASNPNDPLVWIGYAKLEEKAGKIKKAKSVLLAGCEKCPNDVNLWLEAVRMHPRDEAKVLLVKAIEKRPDAIELWTRAADFEHDEDNKRLVYQKALEAIPSSVNLWKKAINLAIDKTESRRLLREAVTNCPQSVELWIALAKMEQYDDAKLVLEDALNLNPTDKRIWICRAKLEEKSGDLKKVPTIIKRALIKVKNPETNIDVDDWLAEAIEAELVDSAILAAKEIIKQVLQLQLDEHSDDSSRQLALDNCLDNIVKFTKESALNCARSVFEFVTSFESHRRRESVWLAYVDFERSSSNSEPLPIGDSDPSSDIKLNISTMIKTAITTTSKSEAELVLRKAVEPGNCANSVRLWLELARENWSNIAETRQILSQALGANPDSEQIVIAAVQFEADKENYDEARRILREACNSAKTPQMLLEWVRIELKLGCHDEAAKLLADAVREFKTVPEFFLLFGQLEELLQQNAKAKEHYSNGLKFNPTSGELWIAMAKFEEKCGSVARARSCFENSRRRNPKDARLWLEAARLEVRASKRDLACSLLAKAVRECASSPNVELLQAEHELLAPKFKRPRLQLQ